MRDLFKPTFRGRLRLFFVVIVVIPMIAVTGVLFWLLGMATNQRRDERLSVAEHVASGLLVDARARAASSAGEVVSNQRLAAAIERRDRTAIQRRLSQLAASLKLQQTLLTVAGVGRVATGGGPGLAPASFPVRDAANRPVGAIKISVQSPDDYVQTVSRLLDGDAQVSSGAGVIATTLPQATDVLLPQEGSVEIDDHRYGTTTLPATSFDGPVTTRLFVQDRRRSGATLVVVGFAAGFLLLALVFAVTLSRTLHQEVQGLLDAARRLGRGDFSVDVPAEGGDELSELAREFNSMASQLESRIEELRRERERLQGAIRRVGESFAKGLDRDGLLEIVVQTAVDGVGAAAGRAMMRDSGEVLLREVAAMGAPGGYARVLHAAEAAVLDAGQVAEIQLGGASALAAPLGASANGDQVVGLVSVARGDRAFTPSERELFSYLTNQAAVSVENQDLHETVQRQAVTDELTGLFNHRRFQEVMTAEVERARRYDQQMGLVMLDIDDFKRVNDTYGHRQGDLVLREVARVLRQTSREIDEPARYGGEEMAVALPQTDLDGAYRFAERVRQRIEGLDLPLLDGDGKLRVTASFGVASLAHAGGTDKESLVAAADAALYRAKRSGKNRTVMAE